VAKLVTEQIVTIQALHENGQSQRQTNSSRPIRAPWSWLSFRRACHSGERPAAADTQFRCADNPTRLVRARLRRARLRLDSEGARGALVRERYPGRERDTRQAGQGTPADGDKERNGSCFAHFWTETSRSMASRLALAKRSRLDLILCSVPKRAVSVLRAYTPHEAIRQSSGAVAAHEEPLAPPMCQSGLHMNLTWEGTTSTR
jgi:hypothetical protein